MNRFLTLIIDDELPARQLLETYLKDHSNLQLLESCSNGFEGMKAIQENHPDLIFLDIQMPKLSGFEMLELLDDWPEIIFTTAYDNFAIQAFEKNAVDYLMKPFSKARCDEAVEKAIHRLSPAYSSKPEFQDLVNAHKTVQKEIQRIVVKEGHQIHVLQLDEVYHIESEEDYVRIHTAHSNYSKRDTLQFYEDHLPAEQFIRVHRSDIVNLTKIRELQHYAKDSYLLILQNDKKVKISRNRFRELKSVLNF